VLEWNEHVDPLLLIHANYLESGAQIPASATIVYCPRTHAAFGHEPYPLGQLLAKGVRIALGTDSLASNPDLNVLAEARFLHKCFPEIAGSTVLHMATLAGAQALGWHRETGSLVPGKSADLVVVPLPTADAGDPHDLLLESQRRVKSVMFRGEWIGRAP